MVTFGIIFVIINFFGEKEYRTAGGFTEVSLLSVVFAVNNINNNIKKNKNWMSKNNGLERIGRLEKIKNF